MIDSKDVLDRWAAASEAETERYARKPDTKTKSLFDDEGNAGHWLTINTGDDHKGGQHVFVGGDGKMKTGAFAGQTMGQAFGGEKKQDFPNPAKPQETAKKPEPGFLFPDSEVYPKPSPRAVSEEDSAKMRSEMAFQKAKQSKPFEPLLSQKPATPEAPKDEIDELLKQAEPYLAQGPNYNRNVASSAHALMDVIARNHGEGMIKHVSDQLKARLAIAPKLSHELIDGVWHEKGATQDGPEATQESPAATQESTPEESSGKNAGENAGENVGENVGEMPPTSVVDQVQKHLDNDDHASALGALSKLTTPNLHDAWHKLTGSGFYNQSKKQALEEVARRLPFMTKSKQAEASLRWKHEGEASEAQKTIRNAKAHRNGFMGAPMDEDVSDQGFKDPHG